MNKTRLTLRITQGQDAIIKQLAARDGVSRYQAGCWKSASPNEFRVARPQTMASQIISVKSRPNLSGWRA